MRIIIRFFSLVSGLALSFAVMALPPENTSQTISKIIFGSCIHQDHEQPIWAAINAEQPDLFVFLGDNVYGDTEDMTLLHAKYQKLGSNKGYQQLKQQTPVAAIWDDHDYGANDAGKDYPRKHESRKIMLDFFQEPALSERRTRDSGIYTSYYFGEGEKSVQLILLDLRWNRTEPESLGWFDYLISLIRSRGPYLPTRGADATILGAQQWIWLEQELLKPAGLRIIASSLQVLPESSGWEAWATFPDERKRLFDLIKNTRAENLFFISGDTHWAEFSRVENPGAYPLWELTSSGLTEEWKMVSPNEHRVSDFFYQANYGFIEIDWQKKLVHLSIKDVEGKARLSKELTLDELRF